MKRKEAAEIVEKYIESFEGGAAIWEAMKMAADALKNEDAARHDAFAEVVELINYKQRRVFSNILRRNMNEWERGYRYALDELEGDVTALKEGNNG